MNAENLEGKTEWTHWVCKITQEMPAGDSYFTWLNRSLFLATNLSLALQQDMCRT